MQGKNRDANTENGPVDTEGEVEGGHVESSADVYTLPSVKDGWWAAAAQHGGLSLALCADLMSWDGGPTGRGYMRTHS